MTFWSAMSSFFSCFRVKYDRRPPRDNTRAQKVCGSRNRLSSLFLSEDVEKSPHKSRAHVESPQFNEDLKKQTKFLKASGTIPKTPAVIRKASDKFKVDHFDTKPAEIHVVEKLEVVESPDQSITPVNLQKKWGMNSCSTDLSPSSCILSVQTSGRTSIGSIGSFNEKGATTVKVQTNQVKDNQATLPPFNLKENFQCKNKSVQLICKADGTPSASSSSENIGQDSRRCRTPGNQSELEPLPYPTPLKLEDAMQTPGTEYPANLETVGNERARIRSQHVYSISNIMDTASQLKNMKGDDPNSHLLAELRQPLRHSEHASMQSEKRSNVMSTVKESMVDISPAGQKKPAPYIDHEYHQCAEPVSAGKPSYGKTHGERPIIGIVATHWNGDDTSHVTPKWWDGNGIPNSTNKYKEDQKVSWHATPFEERLEKALSEETLISLRNKGKPIILDENEENDTAISKRQFSPSSNSAVSC